MPRPAVPFSFNRPVELDEDDESEVTIVPRSLADDKVKLKLIALLSAKGVGYNQIVEIVGEEIKDEVSKAKRSPELSKLINSFAAKLNESVEMRIKRHSQLALDRLLDILNNPKAAPKDILSAAKDILDRELGKAKQSVELTGGITNTDDIKSIQASSKAADERLKKLEDQRNSILKAHGILTITKTAEIIEGEING